MPDDPPDVLPVWPGTLVDVGAWRLHVRRAAPTSAAAEPALLVHGLGGSATNWTDLMGLLRDRLDATAVDLPGFGWSSPAPDGDYSPRGHAAAVAALLEALPAALPTTQGRGPVHLIANSLGGTVAIRVAATRPDLVRTLTLIAPALPVLRPRRSNAHLPAIATPFLGERLMARMGRVSVERRVRATLALCFADPSVVPPQRVEEAVAEARRRAELSHGTDALLRSLRGLMLAYLEQGQESPWRLAARVQAPTLLVYGLRDKLVDPRSADRAARTFPESRLLLLPDSGHVAQMEHPAVVARAVREHLDQHAVPTEHEVHGAV